MFPNIFSGLSHKKLFLGRFRKKKIPEFQLRGVFLIILTLFFICFPSLLFGFFRFVECRNFPSVFSFFFPPEASLASPSCVFLSFLFSKKFAELWTDIYKLSCRNILRVANSTLFLQRKMENSVKLSRKKNQRSRELLKLSTSSHKKNIFSSRASDHIIVTFHVENSAVGWKHISCLLSRKILATTFAPHQELFSCTTKGGRQGKKLSSWEELIIYLSLAFWSDSSVKSGGISLITAQRTQPRHGNISHVLVLFC